MRNWIWMAAALVLLSFLPSQGTELGSLHPVGLLEISWDGQICVETDTGDRGRGGDLQEALRNLKDSTPGTIFLDTAERLILTEDTRHLLPQLQTVLHPTAEVCLTREPVPPETAYPYLKAHPTGVMLQDTGRKVLPILVYREERFRFEG